MAEQSRDQTAAQARQREQEQKQRYYEPPPQQHEAETQIQPRIEDRSDTAAQTSQKSAFQAEEAVSVKGRAGERAISIEWIDVPIGNSVSCKFNIRTTPGNRLEAVLEQASYRKTFSGAGSILTQVVPIAPIGTKGKLVVHDTSTGETLEQPWTWRLLNGGGGGGADLSSLWEKIKKIFWKSA